MSYVLHESEGAGIAVMTQSMEFHNGHQNVIAILYSFHFSVRSNLLIYVSSYHVCYTMFNMGQWEPVCSILVPQFIYSILHYIFVVH